MTTDGKIAKLRENIDELANKNRTTEIARLKEKKEWQDRCRVQEKRGDDYKSELYMAKETGKRNLESYDRSRSYFKNLVDQKNV